MQYQIVWLVFGWYVGPLNGAPALKSGRYKLSINNAWTYEICKLPWLPVYWISPVPPAPMFRSGVYELRSA
jgi:hypothetical protein